MKNLAPTGIFSSALQTGSFPSTAKSPPISRTLRSTRCSTWSAPRRYRRLGFDARLNGPVAAVWTHGDGHTVSVDAQFGLSPSKQTPAGEVPATGAIDATYAHHNGSVALRKLELHLPQSDLEAHGLLGAYPITSPSSLAVDFHSHNLAEFDTALRSLGFKRNGKTGTAALPVSLAGQADYHGAWTGSLARPHLAGTLEATQLAFEWPAAAGSSGPPQIVRFDSVSALGTASPSQIAIQHAQLQRGTMRITLGGTLDASPGASPGRQPVFDANSVLHAHIDATNLEVADVQPIVTAAGGPNLPLTGAFNAHIQADGPLHAPTASGSVQMERGALYGEPVTGLRVQGALAGQVLKLTSVTLNRAGGNISASGDFDFKYRAASSPVISKSTRAQKTLTSPASAISAAAMSTPPASSRFPSPAPAR